MRSCGNPNAFYPLTRSQSYQGPGLTMGSKVEIVLTSKTFHGWTLVAIQSSQILSDEYQSSMHLVVFISGLLRCTYLEPNSWGGRIESLRHPGQTGLAAVLSTIADVLTLASNVQPPYGGFQLQRQDRERCYAAAALVPTLARVGPHLRWGAVLG